MQNRLIKSVLCVFVDISSCFYRNLKVLILSQKLVDKLPRFVEIHTAFRSGFFTVNTHFDALIFTAKRVVRKSGFR